jgi:oligopeptide transport system substrate-binding protein
MKKVISVLMAICIIATLFYGCSSSNKAIDFIYPFTGDVNSYDPQVASTADEFLIIENTFEGLVRVNDDGTVKAGVAESWNISDDGLKYTFNLKKGVKWNIDTSTNSNGETTDSRLELMGSDFNPDITANDFVFALQRAALPETQCPLFSSISCIKNASAVNSGKSSASKLGVKAIDDYTLEITLSSPDSSFLSTLSTAVAMPCNKEFFTATKGRYGLDTKYTLFNGQFYVSQILESSYLLKNNEQYTGPSPSEASELTLNIVDTDSQTRSKILENIQSGYYDAAFISGLESEQISNDSSVELTPYNDTTWAFILNCNNSVLQYEDFRKAFCLGFSRIEETDKSFLTKATNLIPQTCKIENEDVNTAIGKTVYNQNTEKSIEAWKKALKETGIQTISITVITMPSTEDYVKEMIQGIQSGIGNISENDDGDNIQFTLKVETYEEDEFNSLVASGDYDIAFYPYKSNSSNAVNFLKSVQTSNYSNCDMQKVKKAVTSAEQSSSIDKLKSNTKACEKAIMSTYSICPMMFESSYYATAKGVSGIQFHAGTGRVSFVYATREN